MLPDGNESNNRRQQSGGLPFINQKDLTTQPQEGKILMVKFTEKGKQGPSITLKLAFNNSIRYLWVPCRNSDPRYKTLTDAFGRNENDWVDERILLVLEKDEFGSHASDSYKQTIRIPEKQTAPKKGGK